MKGEAAPLGTDDGAATPARADTVAEVEATGTDISFAPMFQLPVQIGKEASEGIAEEEENGEGWWEGAAVEGDVTATRCDVVEGARGASDATSLDAIASEGAAEGRKDGDAASRPAAAVPTAPEPTGGENAPSVGKSTAGAECASSSIEWSSDAARPRSRSRSAELRAPSEED